MIDESYVLNQILTTSNNIDGNIKSELSQNDVITMVANIVAQLRHLAEWCGVFCCLKDYPNQPILNNKDRYIVIQNAFKLLKSKNKLIFLIKFHDMLQHTTSHYTYNYQHDNEYSFFKELLIYTWELKKYFNDNYKIQIISNFKNIYPLLEPPLHDQEFYAKIYSILKEQRPNNKFSKVKYYIVKKNFIFLPSNNVLFYEYTLCQTTDLTNKYNGIIAYSLEDIFQTYSVKLNFSNQVLELNGNKFNINLISNYEISIRMCELKNVNQILTGKSENFSETRKYHELMLHIKNSKCSLAKIICNNTFINEFTRDDDTLLCVFLKKLNEFLNSRNVGYKTLLYLLSSLRNEIVKKQISQTKNPNLSNLFLKDNPCLHFEKIPYLYYLINHVTKYRYLVDVFDDDEYKPQMVARYIRSLSINNNQLFIRLSFNLNNSTLLKEIDDFNKQIEKMGKYYSSKFRIEVTNDKKYCYCLKYFDDTKKLLNCLFNLMKKQDQINKDWSLGVVKNTIRKNEDLFDDEQKNQIIEKMFSKYSLYSVYGVAGSGKTKLIINTLKVFDNELFKILCLSNTNVAVNNIKMRHKNSTNNITFETIYKFNHKSWDGEKYDFLVLDECSNISTRNMLNVLEKIQTYGIKKILLAGDILQLESIDFGGWFEIWKYFLETNEKFKDSYSDLATTWRARKNEELKNFWKVVREHDRDNILTSIYNDGVGLPLDNVLNNSPTYDDTIFLCLNYSGRYGINSINDILQQKNTNQQIEWGKKLYKNGDPIIFDNVNISHYKNILFNNLKGNIQNIECSPNKDFIKFTIILDIDDFDLGKRELIKQIGNLKYIKEENSRPVIELKINAVSDDAYDDDSLEDPNNIVPFHVSYAISIHKSQGIEYKNVNIVISDYVVDNISFNIFYTAITRASDKIKIYWSDKTQKKIIDLLSVKNNSYAWIDFNLIKNLL